MSFYRALKGKGYAMDERGKIELKGYGTLGTYYLSANENASTEDLIGRSKLSNQEVSYINEGKEKKSTGYIILLLIYVVPFHIIMK